MVQHALRASWDALGSTRPSRRGDDERPADATLSESVAQALLDALRPLLVVPTTGAAHARAWRGWFGAIRGLVPALERSVRRGRSSGPVVVASGVWRPFVERHLELAELLSTPRAL